MSSSPLGTNTVTQIALIVRNIEDAIQAWSLLLDVPPPKIIVTDPVELTQAEYQGRPTSARARIAFFQLGQVRLELIEPIGEPSTWQDQLMTHGQSLHHIAFEIKGMADRLTEMTAQGFSLLQRGEYKGGRYAYLDGLERHGAIVELLEND